jgi:hypothetical protein
VLASSIVLTPPPLCVLVKVTVTLFVISNELIVYKPAVRLSISTVTDTLKVTSSIAIGTVEVDQLPVVPHLPSRAKPVQVMGVEFAIPIDRNEIKESKNLFIQCRFRWRAGSEKAYREFWIVL